MGKLAEAFVEIGSRTRPFDEGLAKTEKSLAASVGRMQAMAGTIGVGLGVAGMVKLLADATTRAGSLAETMGKVGQVFGDSKGSVVDMAEGMASQFGAVKQTTLDAAAMFGLIAQGAKFGEKEAAALSVGLVKLADDASSFFDVELDVALEKIRAGLVGESEPLRAFGVMLSEDAVKAEALKMGLGGTNRELDDHAKVAARAQLIMQGLAKATGDHERTLGSLNNQLKKLRGEWSNFTAELGGGIAEVVTPELGRLNTMISESRREGGGAALFDYLASQFKAEPGSIGDRLFGDLLKAAKERAEGPFLPSSLEPQTRIPAAPLPPAVARAFQAFAGGGFGAFGMFGQLGQMINAGPAAEFARMRPRESSSKFDAAGFGSYAIGLSLEAPQAILQQIKAEEQKANEKLAAMLDLMKVNRPGRRDGVFPRRGR